MTAGRTLLHYELIEEIGRGGMGHVWRARDTRLGRDVAIKLLPPEFSEDEERLRRFEREAKLLASLNHTHIAQIHGVEQVDSSCFLVLELVGGETLAERLAREGDGGLPLEEALDIARQIAEGLEAAHEAGIVHRWIAYTTDSSGQSEVYVAPTEGGPVAQLLQVSFGGGREPRWSPDGARLYYRTESGQPLAVPVASEEGRLRAGASETVFDIDWGWPHTDSRNSFDFMPDGQSLVILRQLQSAATTVQVQTGWKAF